MDLKQDVIVGHALKILTLQSYSKRTAVTITYIILVMCACTVQIQSAAVHHSVSHSLSCDDNPLAFSNIYY